ncbi:MAG: OB-fold nucleic acid binding domain-containing protein, partial [Neisseria sp.]|nr:OB-fold nucleic acid binding domain-containing protein [Neisseria sp.]
MSSELTDTDQLKLFYEDAQDNGIEFLPPDINESDYLFVPDAGRRIRYALGAVKGVGEGAAACIVRARQDGLFRDLFDFCERVGKEHINKRTLESLIKAGAFDSIEPNRAKLLANADLAISHAEQRAVSADQGGLFDFAQDAIGAVEMADTPMWGEARKLAEEKGVLGFYLSGHPFAPYAGEVRRFAPTALAALKPQESVRVAGFVTAIRTILGKKGKVAFVQLEDGCGKAEAVVGGELLQQAGDILKADRVLIMECRISRSDFNGGGLRINANSVMTLQQARGRFARSLSLTVGPGHDVAAILDVLHRYRANGGTDAVPLHIAYCNGAASGELSLPHWRLAADDDLFDRLTQLVGEYNLSVGW